jgi:hypothetical protein
VISVFLAGGPSNCGSAGSFQAEIWFLGTSNTVKIPQNSLTASSAGHSDLFLAARQWTAEISTAHIRAENISIANPHGFVSGSWKSEILTETYFAVAISFAIRNCIRRVFCFYSLESLHPPSLCNHPWSWSSFAPQRLPIVELPVVVEI